MKQKDYKAIVEIIKKAREEDEKLRERAKEKGLLFDNDKAVEEGISTWKVLPTEARNEERYTRECFNITAKKAREEEREKILKELSDLRIDQMEEYIKNLKNKE